MRMKAMFADEDEQLWPGDFVNARVSLKVLRGAVTVPSAAIQSGPKGIFAWVVAEGDVVQARPITSGPTTDGRTMITSGLTEGDRVVVNGQYKLRQNSKVTLTCPRWPSPSRRSRHEYLIERAPLQLEVLRDGKPLKIQATVAERDQRGRAK
jgi:multidrug efflux system membrane fusion protein